MATICLKILVWNEKRLEENLRANTLFKGENERHKIEPVPIPLPRASRNFPDVKTRNDFYFL